MNTITKVTDLKEFYIENGGSLYWKDKDFDKGIYDMKYSERLAKAERVKLLRKIFFDFLNSVNSDIYITPYYYEEENCFSWFEDWGKMSKIPRYKEIIKEANRNNIYLKNSSVIPYEKYRELAVKFFNGNVSYISKAYYIIPSLKIMFRPYHDAQLVTYGNNEDYKYKEIIKYFLSKSDKLEYWLRA